MCLTNIYEALQMAVRHYVGCSRPVKLLIGEDIAHYYVAIWAHIRPMGDVSLHCCSSFPHLVSPTSIYIECGVSVVYTYLARSIGG